MKRLLLLCGLTMVAGSLWPQVGPPDRDSLRAVAYHEKASVSARQKALLRLSMSFFETSLDSSYHYSQAAYQLAEQANLPKAAGQALVLMGYAQQYQGERDSAQAFYHAALRHYQTANDSTGIIQPGVDLGQIGDHPGKGTGLGLRLCREMVERHGGSIEARPAMGGGAEFRVFFPDQTEDHA